MELIAFFVLALLLIASAIVTITNRNPVSAAVSLAFNLVAIAGLYMVLDAQFIGLLQVIVYAGAIVVLFLFVLMLLGVDRSEDLSIEPLGGGQRIAAGLAGLGILALSLLAFASTGGEATGAPAAADASNAITTSTPDVAQLGESLFTTYLFAFEVTSVLLVIAVVGAVVLARKVKRAEYVTDPLVEAASASAPEAAAEISG